MKLVMESGLELRVDVRDLKKEILDLVSKPEMEWKKILDLVCKH